MPDLIVFINLLILAGLGVFFWKRHGKGSGRSFGHALARHLGLRRSTFWYLLENGAPGAALQRLAALEKAGVGLEQAGLELGPVLHKGLQRLEERFGPQEIYEQAKPVVARLLAAAPGPEGSAG